jgi:predicted negative regulator of RcsB-dependent stress response
MRSTLFVPIAVLLLLPIVVNIDASTFTIYPLLGVVIGAGLIIGFTNYQTSTTNNQPSKKSKSDTTTGSTQNQSDTKQTGIMGLRNKADELLIEADSLKNDRRFAEANDLYQDATERYRSAIEQCEDEDVIRELSDELEIVEQKRDIVKQILEILPEIQEALELGESSLQTAIAAHVNEESTIARIRYRQARDQYQIALEQIEETDIDLFTDPIEIAVNRERSVESRSISDIFELTANEADKIQFETISDIQREKEPIEVDDDIILPRAQKLLEDNLINRELAYQLTALYFLYEENTFQFTSEKQIESRLQQAISGYNTTK